MIFPEHCKYVGHASTQPCGDRVYFLSRYLLRDTGSGYEVLEVTPDPTGKGMMRDIVSSQCARPRRHGLLLPGKSAAPRPHAPYPAGA